MENEYPFAIMMNISNNLMCLTACHGGPQQPIDVDIEHKSN